MGDHYQVTVTAPNQDEALRLSRMAVERRLAACGQVSGPITSTFWWQGGMESVPEWSCTFKTTGERVGPLMDAVRAEHSYDVPEIIAFRIESGDPDYLAWLDSEARSRAPGS
ncbi:MAG TPA: divalent-cation tolerance protein CutA [Acidimicrobiales bacterium]|nr:divalent-cation tolerance protein CutA [Acidimicrobiales bacterium]